MSNVHYKSKIGRGAGAYADIGVESGVMAADPHRLIVLLFDGAEGCIRRARAHIADGNTSAKGEAISKAIDIINKGLIAALDTSKGGEVAQNLGRIYEYIGQLLLQANLRNDGEALLQAERLLVDISSAWRQIGMPAIKQAEAV
jgi:flagellar protein FliS